MIDILQKIEQLYSRLPKLHEVYHIAVNKELKKLDLNLTDQKLRNAIRKEKQRLIRIRKIGIYAEHLQRRRVDLLETEQKVRRKAKFVKRDLVLEAEEIAFFEKLEKERIQTTTHRRGQSNRQAKKEKAIATLRGLGFSKEEAEHIAQREVEE